MGATSGLLEPIYDESMTNTWNLVCFKHNTDIYPDTCISCNLITGMKEFPSINNQVTISPNPASSEITVSGRQEAVGSIDVYNTLGEKVYTSPITDYRSPITINISALPSGMYFAEIKTEKGATVRKFVKQ